MLLCLASLLTTLKENFGAPIDCIVDKDLPKSVFEVEKVFLFRNFSLPYAWHFRPTAGSMAPSHYPPRYTCYHQAKTFVGNICQKSVNICVPIFFLSAHGQAGERFCASWSRTISQVEQGLIYLLEYLMKLTLFLSIIFQLT